MSQPPTRINTLFATLPLIHLPKADSIDCGFERKNGYNLIISTPGHRVVYDLTNVTLVYENAADMEEVGLYNAMKGPLKWKIPVFDPHRAQCAFKDQAVDPLPALCLHADLSNPSLKPAGLHSVWLRDTPGREVTFNRDNGIISYANALDDTEVKDFAAVHKVDFRHNYSYFEQRRTRLRELEASLESLATTGVESTTSPYHNTWLSLVPDRSQQQLQHQPRQQALFEFFAKKPAAE